MTLTDKSGAAVRVAVNDAASRYEIFVLDGESETLAGFAEFIDRESGSAVPQRIIYHTEVPPEFGGRGLAGILTEQELDHVRAIGKHVVPVCPVVAGFLKKHDGYADIADPVTPEILSALRSG
ncbi:GNAT family N-acetyltransferase [Jongsikchunia kroppenstedtii]|uniref:GNAT family N-acetyltransferase n=1 Tax=Jongsikchunia kroppenstedtii TaxID=1121721 RepID=UPI0003689B8B|nr:GNAT family N-acetyltransferase [Jongsikchunia kroppenstedtii]